MRLVALVESADHVCCRYRLAAFRPALEEAGHTLDLVPLPKRWWSRLLLFRRLRDSRGRVVLTSSAVHRSARLEVSDLEGRHTGYSMLRAYGNAINAEAARVFIEAVMEVA